MKMKKQPQNSALVVVDVQNGFTPGGNLAVADADTIIPTLNQLARCFENVVLTQIGIQIIIFFCHQPFG